MGACNCSMFCCTLLYVQSSIAIILMGKRELVALLYLSSWCLVMVERLFLAVPWGCLRFVIVVFLDHTHLLYRYIEIAIVCKLLKIYSVSPMKLLIRNESFIWERSVLSLLHTQWKCSYEWALRTLLQIEKVTSVALFMYCNNSELVSIMSQCMRFPTMWYVRPAKPQISLHICAVWSEPLLLAWVFYDC